MQITTVIYAPEHSRFAPDAFANQVGARVAVYADGPDAASTGTIVSVKVTPPGLMAVLTLELGVPS